MSEPQAEVAPVTTTPPTDPVQTNQTNIQVNIDYLAYHTSAHLHALLWWTTH
jgi:hypothetical protein